jgi:hypothetical protein
VPAKIANLVFWLMLGSLATAAIYWQLIHPPQPLVSNKATKRPPELPTVEPTQPFQLPPVEQFSEISGRPAFIVARRPEPLPPPEEEAPPPVTPVVDKKFMLLGVIMTPKVSTALIRPDDPNAKAAPIKIGQMVGDWHLEAIFPNRVIIRKEQATQELTLVRPKKAAGPRAKHNSPKPGSDVPPPAPVATPLIPAADGLPPSVSPPAQPLQMDN